jgi:hypothetical protein
MNQQVWKIIAQTAAAVILILMERAKANELNGQFAAAIATAKLREHK